MERVYSGHSKQLLVLIAAVISIILWLLSLFYSYTEFQNTRLDDPLAELNSLVPLYYIAIGLLALACVGCLFWCRRHRLLHIGLLLVLACMLWLTPYIITGFVRLPDGPWHVGSAVRIADTLEGIPVPASGYAWNYPGSFIYHNYFLDLLGVEPLTYIYFFPFLCTFLLVLLLYSLFTRLFDSRTAFLSLLIAFPGLHYLQLHASPHTIGALLMLTMLVLLATRSSPVKVMPTALILLLIIVVVHPITPLLIASFLGAALLVGLVYARGIDRRRLALAGLLVICLAVWFAWFYSLGDTPRSRAGIPDVEALTPYGLGIFSNLTDELQVVGGFLTGTRFIYGNIFALNKGIYFLYAALGVLAILYRAADSYLKRSSIGRWLTQFAGLRKNEALLAVSVVPLIALAYMLGEGAYDLIETGLTYAIIALSGLLASVVIRTKLQNIQALRLGAGVLVVLLVLLVLSYPVIAYSIDAYSNFPYSEKKGLQFLTQNGALEGKTLMSTNTSQIVLYIRPEQYNVRLLKFQPRYAPIQSGEGIDLIVFRNTGYYYSAMRYSFSFDDNYYNDCLKEVQDETYNKVYSSPTTTLYVDSEIT